MFVVHGFDTFPGIAFQPRFASQSRKVLQQVGHTVRILTAPSNMSPEIMHMNLYPWLPYASASPFVYITNL